MPTAVTALLPPPLDAPPRVYDDAKARYSRQRTASTSVSDLHVSDAKKSA